MAPQVLIPLHLSFRCHVLRKHGATNNENEQNSVHNRIIACSSGVLGRHICSHKTVRGHMRENRIFGRFSGCYPSGFSLRVPRNPGKSVGEALSGSVGRCTLGRDRGWSTASTARVLAARGPANGRKLTQGVQFLASRHQRCRNRAESSTHFASSISMHTGRYKIPMEKPLLKTNPPITPREAENACRVVRQVGQVFMKTATQCPPKYVFLVFL